MNTQLLIKEFLGLQRFAIIGVSRNPKDFSRSMYNEFVAKGYDVLPVNPLASDIDGKRCYSHITDIDPKVSAALLMTSKAGSEQIIHDCAQAGVTLVWLYGIAGAKDVHPGAVKACEQYGIRVIAGYCPFMVMETSSWFHHLHGTVWKVLGMYPK